MGKKTKNKGESGKKEARVRRRSKPNWVLLVLSGIGILLTGYLTSKAFTGSSLRGCAVGSACDVVLSSRWATFMGMPTAFWGFLTYTALAVLSFVRREDRHWAGTWLIAFFGFLYSLYLTTVSMTVLNAACPYCLTSLGLMTAIFVLATFQRPASLPDFSWVVWLKWTVPAGLVLVLVLHLHYSGYLGEAPAAEDPAVRAFTDHLSQAGAKFYGASWCPHCQQQKERFGRSANRLPYVECSLAGPGSGQTQECNLAAIKSYPTWIINGRRIEEIMSLKQLADTTGYKGPLSSN